MPAFYFFMLYGRFLFIYAIARFSFIFTDEPSIPKLTIVKAAFYSHAEGHQRLADDERPAARERHAEAESAMLCFVPFSCRFRHFAPLPPRNRQPLLRQSFSRLPEASFQPPEAAATPAPPYRRARAGQPCSRQPGARSRQAFALRFLLLRCSMQ